VRAHVNGLRAIAAAVLLATAPLAARAATPRTYAVGSFPVVPLLASVELPIRGDFRTELGALLLTQGTYDDHDPFAYLSAVSPSVWLHFDGVRDLRLSLAFQEIFYRAVAPMGIRDSHEERFVGRARIQQPRGAAAVYELGELDVRSFDDATGTHQIVYRLRFRAGLGLNLDAQHIHSLVLFQEVAFRFSDSPYVVRPFDFFRAFVGYMWTTRRGTFVTLGLVGQISLSPAATRYDFLYGPALSATYRFRSKAPAEAPPPPAEVDVP
jgi:hypothetical protein